MKFDTSVLLKIMSIVQDGLLKQIDISNSLREIEVAVDPKDPTKLTISPGT